MTNGNDQAYASWANEEIGHYGLTKREYFAAMALQGMLAGDDKYIQGMLRQGVSTHQAAVVHADALIDALNKEQP